MMDTLQAAINRQVRGLLLKVLQINNPQPTGSNILELCLVDAGFHVTAAELSGHLRYLADKGYVELNEAGRHIGVNITLVRLTSQGVDLLEGSVTDPGVVFG